jgi:hypothetical protein
MSRGGGSYFYSPRSSGKKEIEGESRREREAHLFRCYVKRRWLADVRKRGDLKQRDALARRPTVAARVRVEFDASQPTLGFVSGWLGLSLGDSICPYKFARDGLFGSLPSAFAFLP